MFTKSKLTGILVAIALPVFNTAVAAGDHHGANALDHSAIAGVHGEQQHLELMHEQVMEALHHAEISAHEHHNRHTHMQTAVTKLKEAMDHINQKHAELATKSVNEAHEHIHKSFE